MMWTLKFDLRRYRWLIPVVFMGLASLACSPGPSYDPPMVRQIQADANVPGKAYALVEGHPNGDPFGKDLMTQVYETRDYGEIWSAISLDDATQKTLFPEIQRGSLPLDVDFDGNLNRIGSSPNYKQQLWSLPRATFRYFFNPGGIIMQRTTPFYVFFSAHVLFIIPG